MFDDERDELRRTLQQAQLLIASAEETLRNVNGILEDVRAIVAKLKKAVL